jgi:hypothetical protein
VPADAILDAVIAAVPAPVLDLRRETAA